MEDGSLPATAERRATDGSTIWSGGFALMCAAAFLMSASFYFLMPTLPLFAGGDLHADNTHIGLILAVYTIAALAIRPFGGYWVDRFGRKRLYLATFAAFSLLFVGYALARSVAALYVVRVLHGLAWGLLGTAGGALIVDLVPAARRGEGIGVYGLSFTVAMAVGPAIGLRLGETAGFAAMFLVAAGLSAAGLVIASAIPYPAYRPPDPSPALRWSRLIERTAVPASLNMLVVTVGYGGLLPWVAVYGKEIGVPHPGTFFVIFAVGIGVARVAAGRIFDRRGPALIVSAGTALLAAGFPLLALVKTAAGFYGAAALLGAGMGVLMPTFTAMVNNMVPVHRRGAANSTFMTAFDLGIGIGNIATGALADHLPLSDTFLMSAALAAAALLFFTIHVGPHYRRHRPEEEKTI